MFRFVNAHLEAHDHNLKRRNQQYANILSSMVFRTTDPLQQPKQAHETSHLFVMGDLNYRLVSVPATGYPREPKEDEDVLTIEKERMEMVDLDSLRKEQREGRVFGGLREGDLSRFAPTYKRIVGQVDGYSKCVHIQVDDCRLTTQKTHTGLHRSDSLWLVDGPASFALASSYHRPGARAYTSYDDSGCSLQRDTTYRSLRSQACPRNTGTTSCISFCSITSSRARAAASSATAPTTPICRRFRDCPRLQSLGHAPRQSCRLALDRHGAHGLWQCSSRYGSERFHRHGVGCMVERHLVWLMANFSQRGGKGLSFGVPAFLHSRPPSHVAEVVRENIGRIWAPPKGLLVDGSTYSRYSRRNLETMALQLGDVDRSHSTWTAECPAMCYSCCKPCYVLQGLVRSCS